MGRRSKVQRSAEEKFAIVMEDLKSGKASETCRKARDWSSAVLPLERRVAKGAWLRLGEERNRTRRRRAEQTHQATGACLGAVASTDRNPKKRVGRVSCGRLTRRPSSSWPRAVKRSWWPRPSASAGRLCTTSQNHASRGPTATHLTVLSRLSAAEIVDLSAAKVGAKS